MNINDIIKKSVAGKLSSQEENQLAHWLMAEKEHEEYYAKMKAIWTLEEIGKECPKDEIFISELSTKMKRNRLKRFFIKYVAAAIVLLSVGIGGYRYVVNEKPKESSHIAEVPQTPDGVVVTRNYQNPNVIPASEIQKTGYVIDKGKKEIVLTEISGNEDEEIVVSIRRGYQYKIILPDSTKVWLNSESELRYKNFGLSKREVALKGEACFDVVRDEKRPFVVKLNHEQSVTVLGTFFSVKAYHDEKDTRVSLVKGRVNVRNGNENVLLTPNKEAIIDHKNNKISIADFDSRKVMTWVEGGVYFYDEELDDIAREMSRRYNKEFEFVDELVKSERLTIILESVSFDEIIHHIKKAGKGVFDVSQKKDTVVFQMSK